MVIYSLTTGWGYRSRMVRSLILLAQICGSVKIVEELRQHRDLSLLQKRKTAVMFPIGGENRIQEKNVSKSLTLKESLSGNGVLVQVYIQTI